MMHKKRLLTAHSSVLQSIRAASVAMAMIYAQSRSELQTVISIPPAPSLDQLDYTTVVGGGPHQQQILQGAAEIQHLLEDSNATITGPAAIQCHQLDGSVICNTYSETRLNNNGGDKAVYNPQLPQHQPHHHHHQQQQPMTAYQHGGNNTGQGSILDTGRVAAAEDMSTCVPPNLPDMPSITLNNTAAGSYSTSSNVEQATITGGIPQFIEETPEQSSMDDCCSLEHQTSSTTSETDIGLKGLSWQAFMVDSWHQMCDSHLLEISNEEVAGGLSVEADKGFHFSPWDESFVCQKKNHFQISIQLRFKRLPKYIKTDHHEIQHIHHFCLHLYGVKFEAPSTVIPIEQSKTDRSKLPYEPMLIDFPTAAADQVVKTTACRLHFSETTANNMRKRGKPNPDQKYFALVVAVHAYTATNDYLIVAYVSERIIVRASNPGQFDNEGDSIWTKNGSNGDSAYYHGRVGINTESPDESLTVVGNVSVTGNLLHPSDKRLKQNIQKIPTREMLNNVCKMTLYSYSFKQDAFTTPHDNDDCSPSSQVTAEDREGIDDTKTEIGLIAQEVQMIIPDAIHEKNFQGVNDLQMINKDRILMELLGAVQELCREKDQTSISLLFHQQLSTIIVVIFTSIIVIVFMLLIL